MIASHCLTVLQTQRVWLRLMLTLFSCTRIVQTSTAIQSRYAPMKVNEAGRKIIGIKKGDVLKTVRLIEVERALPLLVRMELYENQFSAVASFIMDIGIVRFKTCRMRKILNDTTLQRKHRLEQVERQFDLWANRSKKLTKQKRRMAEKELFRKPSLAVCNPEVPHERSKSSP